MTTKTFLALVNDALYESKVNQDLLTPTTFATPPHTQMYDRFKKWVNMGYKELYLKRPDWFFRKERGVVEIWPRIHIAGLSYIPAPGDILVGRSSGVRMTVKGVYTFERVEGDTLDERSVSVQAVAGYNLQDLILQEHFDDGATLDIGYLKGLGHYSFTDIITNLDELDMYSVRAHESPANTLTQKLNFNTNDHVVTPVAWENWNNAINSFNSGNWISSFPSYISRAPDGTYNIFPQPSANILLSFDFTRSINDLVLYSDTPLGIPDKYQDYLSWRAVQEYADFDSQSKLFLRATKHVDEYLYWLMRDQLPSIKFGVSRFNVN